MLKISQILAVLQEITGSKTIWGIIFMVGGFFIKDIPADAATQAPALLNELVVSAGALLAFIGRLAHVTIPPIPDAPAAAPAAPVAPPGYKLIAVPDAIADKLG